MNCGDSDQVAAAIIASLFQQARDRHICAACLQSVLAHFVAEIDKLLAERLRQMIEPEADKL